MKTLALLFLAVAAVSAQRPQRQQPIFRVTATQPIQAYQRAQPFQAPQFQAQQFQPQQFQPQQFQPQQYQPRPIQTQQAYYRRPTYRQDAPVVVPIVSQTDVRDEKGYSYSYETGDKTVVQERGLLKPGPEGDYIVAEGSFSFVGSDGVTYTINYKADENGFQPEGAHIPKVPEPTSFQKK